MSKSRAAKFECLSGGVRCDCDLGALGKIAVEDLHRERVLDHSLDDALEWARAVVGVVASLGQEVPRAVTDLDVEPPLSQSRAQAI